MLDLFVLETCPYCKKVMEFLEKENIKYRKIDISDKDSENSLIQIGGKRQVPFLVDKERKSTLLFSTSSLRSAVIIIRLCRISYAR